METSTSHSLRAHLIFLLVWSTILWGLAPSEARAASFDCATAKSAIEIAICANPKVSALDAQMGRAYRHARAQLSKSGQQLLRANQEQFLHSLSAICLSTDPLIVTHRAVWNYGSGLGPGAKPTADCLASSIKARTKSDLSTAVWRVGGRTFLRLASNEIRRRQPSAAGTEDGRVSEESIAFVQIDRPRNSAEDTFNAYIQQLLSKAVCEQAADCAIIPRDPHQLDEARKELAEEEADIGAEVSVTMVTNSLATVDTSVSYYFPGQAHPFYQESRAFWSFALGRELTASDIFDPHKNWDRALSHYAQQHVRATIEGESKDSLSPIESIASISNWQFERGGLRLIFGQYELGGYLSSAEAFLPWSVIGPYLKPNGAIDREAAERGPSKP